MALVSIEDIEALYGQTIETGPKRARLQLDIDAVTEMLEGYLRRKFEPILIEDEEHIASHSGIFLLWGEPTYPVTVKIGSKDADPITLTSNHQLHSGAWGLRYLPPGRRVYVTYIVDTTLVNQYANTLKRIIAAAVIPGLMVPDQIRYKVINNYAVEGTSITYGYGNPQEAGLGEVGAVDLAALKPLMRSVIL